MPSEAVLLDTHCWVWVELGVVSPLSKAALSAIRRAESRGNLLVSVISVWELGMLEKRGRVALPRNIRAWIDQICMAIRPTVSSWLRRGCWEQRC